MKKARHEGFFSLWSGTVPSLMLVSNPAIKFTAYEYLKRKVLELRDVPALDSGQAFFIGVMSGLMATIATYPIQVVQTKLRVSNLGEA